MRNAHAVSLRDHVAALRAADQRAIEAERETSREAQRLLAIAVETNRAAANEWREAMKDREAAYLTRREFYLIVGTACTVAATVGAIVALLAR